MFSSRLVVLLLVGVFFAAAVAAASLPKGRSFVEEQTQPISLPAGWRRISHDSVSHSDRKIELLFAVKRRNVDILEETFWAVSDPKNERYGQHLSFEALTDLVGPTQSTVDEIVFWLKSNGVHDVFVSQGRDYIRAFVSVNVASRLFEVKFHQYKHQTTGKVFEATLGPYTVPTAIAEKLDLVTGLVGFPDVQYKPKIQHHENIQAKAPITPAVIRARYNITDDVVSPNPNNARAVAEFQAQYYSPSDLKDFYNKFVDNAPFQDVAQVIGYNDPSSPGLEASLDIQYIAGVVPNISTWFYSMKQFNFWNDLVRWTAEIANETNPPLVHSVSYGEQGNYPSITYRDRLNGDFLTLGSRGISIIFASGDDGAGCEGSGEVELSAACDCSFYPSFPATCPYTTSVGATAFISGNSGPESAVSLFKSGGGFSYIFNTLPEQDTYVHSYLASGVTLPESCAFNASGRATPDVSALGDEAFQVFQGGSVTAVGGTSASAPTFSSIISLLNEQRLNAGKSPLGFLNPWIYQNAAVAGAFYDVTVGDNKTPRCCKSGNLGGFECAPGYDPVTGVGTPNYNVLKTLI